MFYGIFTTIILIFAKLKSLTGGFVCFFMKMNWLIYTIKIENGVIYPTRLFKTKIRFSMCFALTSVYTYFTHNGLISNDNHHPPYIC